MYNDNNIIFAIIANLRQNVLFGLDFAPVGPISVKIIYQMRWLVWRAESCKIKNKTIFNKMSHNITWQVMTTELYQLSDQSGPGVLCDDHLCTRSECIVWSNTANIINIE